MLNCEDVQGYLKCKIFGNCKCFDVHYLYWQLLKEFTKTIQCP